MEVVETREFGLFADEEVDMPPMDSPSKDLETLEFELARALADQSIPSDKRVDLEDRIEAIRAQARDPVSARA